MVAVAGLVSLGVGLIAAWAMLRRARAKLRRNRPDAQWSWEEWRAADPLGGRWSPLISIASFTAVAVGAYGFGTPSWLRAGLIGVVTGVCLPPFLHGVWLLVRSRTGDWRS
jgi:hypothetical protein